MRQKKLLSLVLTVALVLGCVTIPTSGTFATESVSAGTTMKAQTVKSGKIGSGDFTFKWTLDNAGTLKLTGKNFLNLDLADIKEIRNDVKKIEIASGITGVLFNLSDYGTNLMGLPNLKELSLATTVKELMGDLGHCENLETVAGGKNIRTVSGQLFKGTKWIKSTDTASVGKVFVAYNGTKSNVTIPQGIVSISNAAFAWNKNLTEIKIPESVTLIEENAFRGCTALTSINGGKNVSRIGSAALDDVPWVKEKKGTVILGKVLVKYKGTGKIYTVPTNIKGIYDEAFSGCRHLESVTVKGAIGEIPVYTFKNCVNLKKVTLPKSVTAISYGAFDHCGALASIKLPSSLERIGTGAFIFCGSLSKVEVNGGANNTKLWDIGIKAFGGCTKLKSLTIPKKVSSIGSLAYGYDLVDDYTLRESKIQNATIYGVKGTEAQKYANGNAITFKSIKDNGKGNEGTSGEHGEHSTGTRGKVVAPAEKTKNGLKAPDLDVYIAYWESHRFHEVKFSKVKGAAGYQIYYSFTGKSGGWKKAASPKDSTVYWDFDWNKGKSKTCYYKVRAYKKVNGKIKYGAFSKVKKIK